MADLPVLNNAWLLIKDSKIENFGTMPDYPDVADQEIDCTGRMIFPCWTDSHTHLVFAASRENEFVDRIHGLTYAEIAAKGGGILNSAHRLQQTDEEVLYQNALQRIYEIQQFGTGAVEIKSGYGLTPDAEIKMLRVIRRLKESVNMPIKATFLGAHALPT